MKSTKSKPAAVQTKRNGSFFGKDNGSGFFGASKNRSSFFTARSRTACVQTKLTVGKTNDAYEQEADSVADQVVQRMAVSQNTSETGSTVESTSLASGITPVVQRKCAECEKEEQQQEEPGLEGGIHRKAIFESDEEAVQRKCSYCEQEEKESNVQRKGEDGGSSASSLESKLSSKSGGSPLPKEVNQSMGQAFGTDFSHVRVHTDSSAVTMSRDLHAQAFTYGSDIYFNAGKYNTNSTAGKHLLAHELTHTVQQGSGGKSVSKKIQRVSLFYWEPRRYNGNQEHKLILDQISAEQGQYVTEGPIPNAQRGKKGPGSAAGYAKNGYVDLYKGTGKKGDTIMGVYFFAEGKPVTLPRKSDTKQNGALYTGAVAPNYVPVNKVTNVDEAPGKIVMGDLKPINSLESSFGKEQLEAYKEGIENYAAPGVNALSTTSKWDPKVSVLPRAELARMVPDRFKRNAASPIQEESILKGPGADDNQRVRTRLVAIPDLVTKGILAYAWIPDEPFTLAQIPPRIRQMGKDVTDYIINPLKKPLAKRKPKGPQKKSIDGSDQGVPETKRAQNKKVQREPDEFELKVWKEKREKLVKDFKAVKGSKELKEVERGQKRMDADKVLNKRMDIPLPSYGAKETEATGDLKSIRFWTNPLAGAFGFFKNLLGSAFDVFANGFTKLKGWIQGIARKLKFQGSGGGLLGSAFKAIFNLLKVVARATVHNAIELLKQDIVTSINRKIDALMKSLDIDKDIAYIKSMLEPVQKIIDSVESWITTTLARFNSYFDVIHKIVETFSFINDIVSKVRWAARAIACVSPPLVGCLWMLAQAALEKAASYIVETCWFRTKIAPIVMRVNVVKDLGKELYLFIKKIIREFLPAGLQEIFVDDAEKPVAPPTEADLKCEGGSGEGEGGGGEITPEQEAVMKMQEEMGEEKFAALLELLQKSRTDANTLMSSEQIQQLAKSLKDLSAQDIKKIADAYQRGDGKSVQPDVQKAIENLKNAPKGKKSGDPEFDAKAKEQEVDAAEARKDARQAAEDQGSPPPDPGSFEAEPAALLLDLMLHAKARKDQIIYEERGKVIVNKSLLDTLRKTGVQIYELKVSAIFNHLDVIVKEVTRDALTMEQITIVVDIRISLSDNPSIAPGTDDRKVLHILRDPRTREVIQLQKPGAVVSIVEGIQRGDTGLVGKVYVFKEFGFKARLANITVEDDVAAMSFVTTEISEGQTAAIFDFKRNKFVTLKRGEPFQINDQCPDCNKKKVQKKDDSGMGDVMRKPAFESEREEKVVHMKCEHCHEEENNVQRMPLATTALTIQRDVTPGSPEDKAAQVVYDALSGWTTSEDSATIRSQVVGKSKAMTDAINLGVAQRAGEQVTYAMEWMESDMVTSDWKAVLGHLITVKAYLVERVIGYKLYSLLLGYTSEDDSKAILALLLGDSPATGDLLDKCLVQLEGKGEYGREYASEKLFGDMLALDAQKLAAHFFANGEKAQGYASHWRAYKIKELLRGFSGISDSESIVKNFEAVPGKLNLTVLFELNTLCQAEWKESAETVMMHKMQEEDYEKVRALIPSLAKYDPTKSWLEWSWSKLLNLGDYIEGAFEYVLCGVLGVILGILTIITDLIGAIIDIVVAAKDLLGMIIYYVTRGKFCRESKEKVFNFFKGIGEFFDAPGDAISMMWGELTGEAELIEGPFAECQKAVFWVTRVTNLLVNIVLIFVAGYGAVKLALEGIEAIVLLVRSGELINAIKAIPGKLWTAIKKLPPALAKAAATKAKAIVELITKPAKVIATVREAAALVKLAATDEQFFLFMRQQANEALKKNLDAFKEKELDFWRKRKEFWSSDSGKLTTGADTVDGKLVDAAGNVAEDGPKAEKIAGEAEGEASNLSKEADDALDDIATTGGEGTKSMESQLPEAWREGSSTRPPRLGACVTRMRGLGISEETILGIIRNASTAQGYDPLRFFGDLNSFIIRFETMVGRGGFDEIIRALASEKDFVMARTLMTQASNGQNLMEIMKVLNVADVSTLRPRFSAIDKDFINDLTRIVSRVAGGRDEIFIVLQDAADPQALNQALDRLGTSGKFTPKQIRESLAFGQQLAKAVSTNADAVAKAIWGDAVESDVQGKVVRDAKGQLKFTGKVQPNQASAYIRARREQIADVILKGHGGTAIDSINWGIIREVLTNTDLPTIVKNDIIGEVWAFTKVRQYENLGYTVIREVFFKIVGADGAEVEAHLDAVLKKGNDVLYKEFKSSATASTSTGQGKVYDLLNRGATESLKPFGPNAEAAFGGPGCPNFKAKPVEFDRPPF
jgi:hypothetical protein